jgi:Ankyrin repeats (many copies)
LTNPVEQGGLPGGAEIVIGAGRHDILQDMVNQGLDLTARDKLGRTALHLAAGGTLEMVEVLVAGGAASTFAAKVGSAISRFLLFFTTRALAPRR